MAIGPILQEARLKKQLTESQVAQITRMKIQLVQDLEKDDFHNIAATIYGKGFIKLYAQCVGLDPKPLIADYVRSVENDAPSLITNGVDNPLVKPIFETQTSFTSESKQHEKTEIETEIEPVLEPEPDPEDLFAYTKQKNTIVDDSVKPAKQDTQPQPDQKPPITDTIKQYLNSTLKSIENLTEKLKNRLAEIQLGDAPIKIIGSIIGIVIILLILAITIKSCSSKQQPATTGQNPTSLRIAVPPPEPYFD